MTDQHPPVIYKEIELPEDFAVATEDLPAIADEPIVSLDYHDVLELGICHHGNGILVVGSKVMPFTGGDVEIIGPGDLHLAQSRRGTTSDWTIVFIDAERLLVSHFQELVDFDFSAYLGSEFHNVISPRDRPDIAAVIRNLVSESKGQPPGFRTAIVSQLALLAVLLKRHYAPTGTREDAVAVRSSVAPVKKALEYIAQRYYEPIEIGTLASLCNMSLRNFSRRFSEALGRTPHEYVVDTRIAVACGHLLRRDVPISCVSDQAGFQSISSFNRAFRDKMGMSPRDWRRHRTAGSTGAGGASSSHGS